VDRTYPVLLPDISGETGHIQSKAGHVCWAFSVAMFNDYFECNLLTITPIDPILLLLASEFCWDHCSAIGKCIHHLQSQKLPRVLRSGHRLILEKNFIGLLFTPPPPSVAPSILHSSDLPPRARRTANQNTAPWLEPPLAVHARFNGGD
jgi:hypothetical protein